MFSLHVTRLIRYRRMYACCYSLSAIRTTRGFGVAALTLRCVHILSGYYLYDFVTRYTTE